MRVSSKGFDQEKKKLPRQQQRTMRITTESRPQKVRTWWLRTLTRCQPHFLSWTDREQKEEKNIQTNEEKNTIPSFLSSKSKTRSGIENDSQPQKKGKREKNTSVHQETKMAKSGLRKEEEKVSFHRRREKEEKEK
jgi:hypothetical protein